MRNLARDTMPDDLEDESSITESSFNCLCSLIEVYEDIHIELFKNFISSDFR